MKNRSPIAVFLLSFVTLGIYGLYWNVKTKGEMNALGTNIPTAWLIIIPLVNIWWTWKYSEGVETVTGGKLAGVLGFILLIALGPIGAAVIQDSFNKIDAPLPAAAAPVAPVADAPTSPVQSTQPEITPPTNPVA